MPANSAYDNAAQALATPATRNDKSTRCRRLLDQLLLLFRLFRAAAAKASMDGNSRA